MGWSVSPLEKVATLQRGFDLPLQEREDGRIPVYGSNGIDGWHNQAAISGPGVITGRSGTIGTVYYEPRDFWPLNTTLYVRDFHGNEQKFIARLLENLDLKRFSASTGVPSLNRNFVHPTPVLLPPRDQQCRISAVLDTVDEAIAKTEAVISKLKQVRAGLLHDLLARGLDENGQLRDPIAHPEQFQDSPQGRIPKEWKLVRVGSETDIEHGFAFDGRLFTDKPVGPRLLVPGNFHRDGGLYFTDENTKYFAGKFPPETVLVNGDVLIVMTDLSPMTLILGRTVLLNEPFRLLHNQRIGKFRFNKPSDWNPAFFVELMNDERLRSKVIREATGTTVRHTSPERIKSGLGVKPRREEQDQIVSAIQTFNSEIGATAKELAKLAALKSGLMNDLLTGRVRVPEGIAVTG